MDLTEIQDELLRQEYPNLLPDHDPDIERYYYLRSMGHDHSALIIYQNRIKPRYPDEEFRTWLLRSYRRHDPAFRGLLAKGYRMLGARSLERLKNLIFHIALQVNSYNEKDVYSTIKTAEEILKFLPPERFEAVASMERYLRYATALNLMADAMDKAARLVQAYLTDTLSVVEEERRRRSEAETRNREQEMQRLVRADWESYLYQKKHGAPAPLIDLSSVVFSPADLARIEIPLYKRFEDQILAYCIKYWNAMNDPAFERVLFLYSRKYGKKNYDVYMAIRRGQMAKQRDDEILASIMGMLVTGYYYSVQGDIYLQRNWNVIKRTLLNQNKALPSPARAAPKSGAETPAAGAPARHKSAGPVLKPRAGIAPRPASGGGPGAAARLTAVVAKPAVKSPAPRSPGAEPLTVKVPGRLKPAGEPRTTILPKKPAAGAAKPAVPVRAAAAAVRPAVPARPAAATIRPAVPARPAQSPAKPVVPVSPAAAAVKPVIPARSAQPPAKPVVPVRPAAAAVKPVIPARPAQPPAKPAVPVRPEQFPAKPAVPARSAQFPAKPAVPARPTQFPVKPSVRPGASAPKSRAPSPPPKKQGHFTAQSLEKAKGSVSDRLKELSGRSYDVYQDRFLAKVRNAIRKVLGTGKGLFFNLPEEAENLVYLFLKEHYSDPYMDWEGSVERKNLIALGFDLPSLYPVIDECYRTL